MATTAQTRRRGRWVLLVGATLAMLVFAATARADIVRNDVAISGTGPTRTITLGDTTDVNYSIVPTPGPDGGGLICDATVESPATVNIKYPDNYPDNVVTANPSTLTFTSCIVQKVTFTASAAGTYSIPPVTVTDDSGEYDSIRTAFTLQVNNPTPSDTTAPVIEPTIVGTLGNNGWYTSDVSLSWTITDPESAWSPSGCETVNITADQQATSYTCSATSAGGTSSKTVAIKRDATAPEVTATPSSAANANGWYTAPFSVSYSATDATSGVAGCSADDSYSGPDTSTGSVSGSCSDNAGNNASASYNLQYDAAAPTLNPTVSPDPVVLNGSASAAPGASDATSGVASAACGAVDTSSVGSHAVACSATDNAGNQATKSASYSVLYATGGSCLGSPGHQILQPINANYQTDLSVFKLGSTVPAKFRVCDANGASIGTVGVVAKFALIQKLSLATNEVVDEAVLSTTPDTAFRWSATDQQWIFNMATKGLKAGTTYIYQVTLNDGSTIDFRFGLK